MQLDQLLDRKLAPVTKKSAEADLVHLTSKLNGWLDTLKSTLQQRFLFVKSLLKGAWTRRESDPVGLGYQANLANLPSPRRIQFITNYES